MCAKSLFHRMFVRDRQIRMPGLGQAFSFALDASEDGLNSTAPGSLVFAIKRRIRQVSANKRCRKSPASEFRLAIVISLGRRA